MKNDKCKILVTGGAGYIGSFTVKALIRAGYNPIIVDNLSTGHDWAVFAPIYKVDLLDKIELESVFKKEKFDAVIHFAALSQAGESMEKPHLYFDHNTRTTNNLLDVMAKYNVKKIIFSSSCSVYGTPKKLPVTEKSPIAPESVYGLTKVWGESMLKFYQETKGIEYIALRYFNVAGGSLSGDLGESRNPQTRLIPNAIKSALAGKTFTLNGINYPTKDGSCVRDYIHVVDLADAHIKALKYLDRVNKSDVFNVAVGKGYSNIEIIKQTEKATDKKIKISNAPRRLGDPAKIYSDNTKIIKLLNWRPIHSNIKSIIESSVKWQINRLEKKKKMV